MLIHKYYRRMLMYINEIFYTEILENKHNMVFQKDRAKEFLLDLYVLHQKPVEMDLAKQIYAYETMSVSLLQDKRICGVFRHADSLFFPSWGYVYDENYAVPELHLKNTLSYEGTIMDIRDVGILCVYYAIHIMLKMHNNMMKKNSVCCSIENKFCFSDEKFHMPEVNYVGFLSCGTTLDATSSFKILSCDIVCFERAENIIAVIDQLLLSNQIENKNYVIYFKNNIELSIHHHFIRFILSAASSGFVYLCLKNMLFEKKHLQFQYVFLAECDPHTKKCAVLLCERIKK